MPIRRPACEPCRSSKLACDHLQPVCTRCRERDCTDECTYRARPFKRRKIHSTTQNASILEDETSLTPQPTLSRNTYPNPGYLGSSSHTTIFGHLESENANARDPFTEVPKRTIDESNLSNGCTLVEQIQRTFAVGECQTLLQVWTARGVNLALAGSFVNVCTQTMHDLFGSYVHDQPARRVISEKLFTSSVRPLPVDSTTTFEDFCASFISPNARWETIGLFFTAIGRASFDISTFDALYNTEKERCTFQKQAMLLSDRCLDTALSLDCLNDLQLMLQYENFILHSYVDGDQSYHTWRRLGDVISSLYALGYHEQAESDSTTASFLADLRRAAFARTYSGDKNLSIFLGRPPRLLRKYCRFQFPGNAADLNGSALSSDSNRLNPTKDQFNYAIDTTWYAKCAILKEDILDLFKEASFDERTRRALIIQSEAEAQWLSLPSHFRLESALKHYDRKSIDCDFMVSARLNYLHVLFLLRSTLIHHMTEPDSQLLIIAASMLSLIAEAMLLKERLTNSGTSLVWKVCYYGLPAAGVICLSLLNRSLAKNLDTPLLEVFRDLNVLIAEVEVGAVIPMEHPNYALAAGATRTIRNILNQVLRDGLGTGQAGMEQSSQTLSIDVEDWVPWTNEDPWDFEIDFWLNLAEHPTLSGAGLGAE